MGETESSVEAAWVWIERNMMPELDTIDDPFEKESWVVEKISMIVTTIGKAWIVTLCDTQIPFIDMLF